MARTKREGYTKRTYRLSVDLLGRLEQVAAAEHRTITAQMEVFLWDGIRQYEKTKAEKASGPLTAARKVA
jgi:hypothetical protein